MNNNKEKNITLGDLARMVKGVSEKVDNLGAETEENFKKADKRMDDKIDDLALMVGKGFNKMDERFERVDERFERVGERFERVENQLKDIKADLNKKVDVFKHNDLTYRVEKLEDKVQKLEISSASA